MISEEEFEALVSHMCEASFTLGRGSVMRYRPPEHQQKKVESSDAIWQEILDEDQAGLIAAYRALQAENERLRKVAGKLGFGCAHCGALTTHVCEAIDNGTGMTCGKCGKLTVVELKKTVEASDEGEGHE